MNHIPTNIEIDIELARENHEWFFWKTDKYECCKKCGVVRRADDKNNPCRGKVKVTVRDKEALEALPKEGENK